MVQVVVQAHRTRIVRQPRARRHASRHLDGQSIRQIAVLGDEDFNGSHGRARNSLHLPNKMLRIVAFEDWDETGEGQSVWPAGAVNGSNDVLSWLAWRLHG